MAKITPTQQRTTITLDIWLSDAERQAIAHSVDIMNGTAHAAPTRRKADDALARVWAKEVLRVKLIEAQRVLAAEQDAYLRSGEPFVVGRKPHP